jgi:hypothetical protein
MNATERRLVQCQPRKPPAASVEMRSASRQGSGRPCCIWSGVWPSPSLAVTSKCPIGENGIMEIRGRNPCHSERGSHLLMTEVRSNVSVMTGRRAIRGAV